MTYERGIAKRIVPGDTVKVYAHPADMFDATPPGGGSYGSDVIGTVASMEPIKLRGTVLPGYRLVMVDGRQFDTIDGAVTTWRAYHDPRPDDDPGPGDRCKDCGRDITWIGPSHLDWMHVNDPRNQ